MTKASNQSLPITITLSDLDNRFEKLDKRFRESEKRVLKEVRKIVNEEIETALKPYARADRLQEAVDSIMHGMEETQKEFVKKKDFQKLYA